MEVNLSRAHHMIERCNEQVIRLSQKLAAISLKYDFKILMASTNEDLAGFRSRLDKLAQDRAAQQDKLLKLFNYIEYLKMRLAEANAACGITAKLTRLNTLTRQIRAYEDFVNLVRLDYDNGLDPVKDVDFYKSAFTEDTRSYSLTLYLYDESSLKGFEERLGAMRRERQSLDDQIASLNQKNNIEIQAFEEFNSSSGA